MMNPFQGLLQPPQLRTLIQSQAMAEAILADDLGEPSCTFTASWGRHRSVAAFNNFQGDDLFLVFDPGHCIAKGTLHDAPLANLADRETWIKQATPKAIYESLQDRAFRRDEATVIAWHIDGASTWHSTSEHLEDVGDGASDLLDFPKLTPEEYQEWAEENYERDVPLDVVHDIYTGVPLTKSMILQLNPDANVARVKQEATKIGYPCD